MRDASVGEIREVPVSVRVVNELLKVVYRSPMRRAMGLAPRSASTRGGGPSPSMAASPATVSG